MDFKFATYDEILTWCDENNQIEWLEEKVESGLSYIELKRAFFEEFMPGAVPPKKPKALSMKEKLEALKAAKAKK